MSTDAEKDVVLPVVKACNIQGANDAAGILKLHITDTALSGYNECYFLH